MFENVARIYASQSKLETAFHNLGSFEISGNQCAVIAESGLSCAAKTTGSTHGLIQRFNFSPMGLLIAGDNHLRYAVAIMDLNCAVPVSYTNLTLPTNRKVALLVGAE